MKKIIFIIGCFLILFFCLSAQTVTKKSPIIIDTDCAPDDLRAICMFASINEINVLAITTSDGALSPIDGSNKVTQLIPEIFKEEIPVAAGRELPYDPPEWREICKKVPWGNDSGREHFASINAVTLISNVITKSENPVTFVCLGPLTNLYDFLNKFPETKQNFDKIIWYNDQINPISGTNYFRDRKAADFILSSNLNISIISNLSKDRAIFNLALLQSLESITTPYVQPIVKSHYFPLLYDRIESGHMQLWDDLVPVYLIYPELFDIKPDKNSPNISFTIDFNIEAVIEKITDILSQEYVINKYIIFEKFPVDPRLYRNDIRVLMNEIIDKYGKEEWRICVLTSEIHGHLGIYSVVGAKMGLKARELLNVGVDRLNVITFAGNIPPLSCLNDGLQISTGATLGQGKITISKDSIFLPKAMFILNDKRIELRLKDTYKKQIESDINLGIVQYGNLTSGYWKLIRELGLKYWIEWDRNEIFDIINLK